MITYNDIYEAKKNPLVLFESPQISERRFPNTSTKSLKIPTGFFYKLPLNTEWWHLFFASDRYHVASRRMNDNL